MMYVYIYRYLQLFIVSKHDFIKKLYNNLSTALQHDFIILYINHLTILQVRIMYRMLMCWVWKLESDQFLI